MLNIKLTGLALIVAIVFLTTASIFSQQEDIKQKKTPEERAVNISSRMQKKLELTDEQKLSVHDALLEAFKQRETDRELYKDDKAARKQAAKTRFEKLDTKFKEILTQEQYKKFDTFKQKKMEKRKMKMKNKMMQKNKLKG